MSLKAKIVAEIIGREGGYSNNPADSGGETMYGVTAAVARANGYTGPMRDMPRATAERILAAEYCDAIALDALEALSAPIAAEMADTAVNLGVGVAGRFLQRALNVFNKGGTLYPDLAVDGRPGPRTVAALRSYLLLRGRAGETAMLRALNALQGARYIELAEARPKDEAFVYGWISNRVEI
ncbi:glycoside hydrolase family 108 protein [Azospirillum argentinense]